MPNALGENALKILYCFTFRKRHSLPSDDWAALLYCGVCVQSNKFSQALKTSLENLKLIRKMMVFFGNIVGITLSKSFLSGVSGRFSFYTLPLLTSLTLQLYYILAHAFIQGNRCLSLFLSPQRMNRCQRFEGQQWTSFCSNLKCPLFRVDRIKETGKQTHPWHNVPASSTWFSLLIGGFLCSSPSSALKHHGGLNDPACKKKKKKR